MLSIAENLSFAEFQEKYGNSEQAYEYWYGRAVPKGMPTWIHGLLQRIVMQLLCEAGYEAASEVELRIVDNAHPKPDVIATKGEPEDPYPTRALEVVVEILSPDDVLEYVIEKCRAYQTWGFARIYVVDLASRSLFQWTGRALEVSDFLTTAPAARIWERLDSAKRQKPL